MVKFLLILIFSFVVSITYSIDVLSTQVQKNKSEKNTLLCLLQMVEQEKVGCKVDRSDSEIFYLHQALVERQSLPCHTVLVGTKTRLKQQESNKLIGRDFKF